MDEKGRDENHSRISQLDPSLSQPQNKGVLRPCRKHVQNDLPMSEQHHYSREFTIEDIAVPTLRAADIFDELINESFRRNVLLTGRIPFHFSHRLFGFPSEVC